MVADGSTPQSRKEPGGKDTTLARKLPARSASRAV